MRTVSSRSTVIQVIKQATAAADGTAGRIRTLIRTRFGRKKRSAQPVAHFGPAERDEVRDRVLEQAKKLGMKPQRAELLALRVAERLKSSGSGG
jgi:DNA-binding response OmpR family regulator